MIKTLESKPCSAYESASNRELFLNQVAQIFQKVNLTLIELAGSSVNQAQGAHTVPTVKRERATRVKPDVGFANDQRMVGKTGIQKRVRHNHHLGS
jgi:hypothetical protein